MRTRFKLVAIPACLAFFFSSSFADPGFDEIDTDGDGCISSSEFQEAANKSGVYAVWDIDNDGVVDVKEWHGKSAWGISYLG